METTDSGSIDPDRVLRWTVTVLADGDELVLPLPEDMLQAVGWGPGDVLEWVQKDDESWILQKKEQSGSADS
jgi:hypothetical protein